MSTEPTAKAPEGISTVSSESASEAIASSTIQVTSPSLPSATPTIISQPTQTATFTPTVTAAPTETSTSTALPLISLTPLPTIPSNQRGQLYAELMTTNNGCQLPCWWGIEMGSSTIEEVVQLYMQFDPVITIQDFPENKTRVTIKFIDPEIEEGMQTTHTFRGQNGIVLEAEIQVHKYENFTPFALMRQFGKPTEVWLWTIPEPYQGLLPASFRFYFPDQGILSAYPEAASNTEDDYVKVCYDGDGGSILLLWNPDIWNPDGSKDFTERANASAELTLEGYQPISEVSNWDEEDLYNNLLNPNSTECLLTPSNLWTSP